MSEERDRELLELLETVEAVPPRYVAERVRADENGTFAGRVQERRANNRGVSVMREAYGGGVELTPEQAAQVGAPDVPAGMVSVVLPSGDLVATTGGLSLRFPYSKAVVGRLKEAVPEEHRTWARAEKLWWISARYAATALRIVAEEWGAQSLVLHATDAARAAQSVLARHGIASLAVGDSVVLGSQAVADIEALVRASRARVGRGAW